MIKRYRIKTSLENYRASFEMLLDDKNPGKVPTLAHMKKLISHYENKFVDHTTFRESYKEIEVVGNSMHDLQPPDFRKYIMGECDCYFFYREDKIIEKNYFIEDPVSIKDDAEYSEYISAWRENNDNEYLKLCGLSLTDSKPKTRRKKAKV